jgi:hypothetical protein
MKKLILAAALALVAAPALALGPESMTWDVSRAVGVAPAQEQGSAQRQPGAEGSMQRTSGEAMENEQGQQGMKKPRKMQRSGKASLQAPAKKPATAPNSGSNNSQTND